MSGESAERHLLPDFVEPDDVSDASLLASMYWGSESMPPSVSDDSRAEGEHSREKSRDGRYSRERKGFGDGASRSTRGGRKKPKKYLTWEQKQQRKEKRAATRAQQDAQEREQDPFAHAREIALAYLSSAPRTRSQLTQRLAERDVEEGVAQAVIDRLEVVGLVDDDEYARMLVRTRIASRGLAKRGLAQELKLKGLSDEVAREALATISDDDEFATARSVAEKKLRSMARLDPQTQKRRLAGALARKGYGPNIIWPVINELLARESASEWEE